jgi:hypothetical protein
MRLRNLIRRSQKRGKDAIKVQRSRHYLDALFDSFKCRNMTRRGFKRAYKRVMDPKRMARDVDDLIMHNRVKQTLRRR